MFAATYYIRNKQFGAVAFTSDYLNAVDEIIHEIDYWPELYPTGNNSVQFMFRKEKRYIEFEILPDLSIRFYYEEKDKIFTGFIPRSELKGVVFIFQENIQFIPSMLGIN